MPHGDIETYYEKDAWHSRVEGETEPFHTSENKGPEIVAGRDEARRRQVEHLIRNLDGTIGERSTYGHDPRNVHG